jgi:hypothetical protein
MIPSGSSSSISLQPFQDNPFFVFMFFSDGATYFASFVAVGGANVTGVYFGGGRLRFGVIPALVGMTMTIGNSATMASWQRKQRCFRLHCSDFSAALSVIHANRRHASL